MAKNTSVILGDHFDRFIQVELESGRYASTSEIIRCGLRLLEEEKQRIDAINQALANGEKSGKPKPFDNAAFKDQMKRKLEPND
ncbi:MAG TPA: type II toxin-antitoxin system ParD family antitoxin [Saprospiraceae bacterium]|nr:type II toxin-antitoxin system ParD family antitoxin [Saprospiraceae bacterium]HRX21350.1 type II toxin-antitoxin system ParD family antitoxin [Syntrophomonadaceae bacterium]